MKQIILPLMFVLAALPMLACGAVGVIRPEATQVSMHSTVVSLQATIAALEQQVAQPQATPLVVTATPTAPVTPAASQAVGAASLGQTLPTATPTASPTAVVIQPQATVVVLVATFTPTPTPERYSEAPVIIEPREGIIVEEQREIFLHWSWNGLLKPGEYFDIKLRPDGQTRSAYVAWERGTGHNLFANLAPGRYIWTVQVIKGSYKNNSGEPEDRIFADFLSPESQPRLLIVAEKPNDDHRKTATPTATREDLDNNDADQPGDDDSPPAEETPQAEEIPADDAPPADDSSTDNTDPPAANDTPQP